MTVMRCIQLYNRSRKENLSTVNRYSELLGFRTLSIVRYSQNWKTQRFGNWICFRPQVRGETPTLLGPLERAETDPVSETLWFPDTITDDGRSLETVILSIMHHRQNPLESTVKQGWPHTWRSGHIAFGNFNLSFHTQYKSLMQPEIFLLILILPRHVSTALDHHQVLLLKLSHPFAKNNNTARKTTA
jgi:hypothetical protein